MKDWNITSFYAEDRTILGLLFLDQGISISRHNLIDVRGEVISRCLQWITNIE
jgi:hypothetical protein